MTIQYKFNRMEFAGSLGDLGTLLPLAIGMIMINGLDPVGVLVSIGLFYILSGLYFGVTVPVQPMKVIGAYAIATAMTAPQILASGALMGVALLVIGATGAISLLGKYTPKAVVRGVQFSTGTLLMVEGIRFIAGNSKLQLIQGAAEPYLMIHSLGPIPIGIVIGIIGALLTLLLLDNTRFPAGLLLVLAGLIFGCVFHAGDGLEKLVLGISIPKFLPLGPPAVPDFTFALFALVLPQIPMTLGNAVIAYTDLSRQYFGKSAEKITNKRACISMGLANIFSFILGGIPLCHGAGGLAAHYRFGARTAGSNMIIGLLFFLLAVFLGDHALSILNLLPMSILGVLLLFSGIQLALTANDVRERKDLFVVALILGITLAANLAIGFFAGIAVAYALKSDRLKI